MPDSFNDLSREPAINPISTNALATYTRLSNPGFFGRIQRKFSVPTATNSSSCGYAAYINRRRSKKLRATEESVGPVEQEAALESLEVQNSTKGRTISESESGRPRKVNRGGISSQHGVVETRRIDRMFQILRKNRKPGGQSVIYPIKGEVIHERPVPVPEKENNDMHVKSNLRCLENVRKLMELQSLNDCKTIRGLTPRKSTIKLRLRGEKQTHMKNIEDVEEQEEQEEEEEEENIPNGTRLAFSIYNGTWPLEFADIDHQILVHPLFEYDDAARGEFYLFYKRIFHYLLIRDASLTLQYEPTFLSRSKLSVQIRARLFDWMIKVQQYLHMRTESLHLAASFVDQYTWRRRITETSYQLVGITALFLAGKVNERIPASLRVLCYLTEHSYNQEQVLEMEQSMLQTLDFDVNTPLPQHFLGNALLCCDDLNQDTRDMLRLLCLYLFDLGLTEVELCKCSASLRCAAVVFLCRQLLISDRDEDEEEEEKEEEEEEEEDERDSALDSSPTTTVCPPPASLLPIWTSKLTSMLGHSAEKELKMVALVYASLLAKLQYEFDSPDSGNLRSSSSITDAAFLKYSNRQYANIARLSVLSTFRYSKLLHEWDIDLEE